MAVVDLSRGYHFSVAIFMTEHSMLRNYAYDFGFVQCAEEFGAICSNRKSYAGKSRLIGIDETTSMK
jgi:hypothetical protein